LMCDLGGMPARELTEALSAFGSEILPEFA